MCHSKLKLKSSRKCQSNGESVIEVTPLHACTYSLPVEAASSFSPDNAPDKGHRAQPCHSSLLDLQSHVQVL